jgi:hypothetical protein
VGGGLVMRTAKPPHFLQGSRGVAAATNSNSNTHVLLLAKLEGQKFIFTFFNKRI